MGFFDGLAEMFRPKPVEPPKMQVDPNAPESVRRAAVGADATAGVARTDANLQAGIAQRGAEQTRNIIQPPASEWQRSPGDPLNPQELES